MKKRILLDIDGVLADFVAGAAKFHDQDPASVTTWNFIEQWGLTAADFWNPLGREFWANLPLTPEANRVVALCEAAVGKENVALLTSPCDTDGCLEGKRDWVKMYFSDYRRRLLIGAAKEFCATPHSLLVDDHDANCKAFLLAGGVPCLFPRPWNAYASRADKPLDVVKTMMEMFARD